MPINTPPTFHGHPINTNIPLLAGDTVEELEQKQVLRVDEDITIPELIARIRYVLNENTLGQINLKPGDTITYLERDGHIGISTCTQSFGPTPLYVILHDGFTELAGCIPVETIIFDDKPENKGENVRRWSFYPLSGKKERE